METVWRVIFLWRFYGNISLEIVWGFHEENMVNLITRTVVWRLYGDGVESDIFMEIL